ncbi:hypothetical protein W97_07920 [Coniosporium apollinis CBS 100218]|uniref:Uncharacterized protein n=1 Tax=Coniosporium apollinis (strain CBS 100218) TaxID=1168221 RepID=R7Z3D2_CONA1|nr:uncharacterized protein W97_07920 [Coniosporium apollinis CBS 100218]EON68662.1 hypothetical protein W97_07920 [Coniosporium apollinis CBS 100218]
MNLRNRKSAGLERLPYDTLKVIFGCLSAAAFYITWGRSLLDGTLMQILALRGAKTPSVPGTNEPLRMTFTGIVPVDYWFTIMVLFFWEALDGSHPDTSLTGVYFLGQLVGIWMLVWLEGARAGSLKTVVSWTVMWACAMQNLTLACFGPIFYTLCLAVRWPGNGAPSKDALLIRPLDLRVLPFSVFLGYILPSVSMALPSPGIVSFRTQQAVISVWTFFPVWVGAIHAILSRVAVSLGMAGAARSPQAHLVNARVLYAITIVVTTVVHVAIVTLSLSTVLFPALYTPSTLAAFAPAHLLFPTASGIVASIGEGVLNFMLLDQYIGYGSTLLWAAVLHWDSLQRLSVLQVIGAGMISICGCLVCGPASVAVGLVWARDEVVLSAEEDMVGGKCSVSRNL